ncbi:MAG: xanthine dehydrogenase family protein molybdopterin-binding subunit [Burkholderiales bacterium]
MNHRKNSPIGAGAERVEDPRLLRGEGLFVDDIHLPGLLHAAVLRSSVAHGIIRAINVASAREMPGVHAVITAADVLAKSGGRMPMIPLRQDPLPELAPFEQPVIAHEKIRYAGEPLALVVASGAAIAEDALDLIEVEIDALPTIANRDESARGDVLLFEAAGSNCAMQLSAVRGDADEAFKTAPYKRLEKFSVHRQTALPMEARGLVAAWDSKRERFTVYGVAKVPFITRRLLARQMSLPVEAVDMIECDVGGSFGVRGEFYPEDFLVPFAARMLGQPVKWIEDRREHLLATNHARDAECELEIACERDGRILALRGRARTDIGAYLRSTGATPSRNLAQVSSGPYNIPHVDVRVSLMLTNKTPVGTYRAPGRFETDFFRERLLDMAAADLGLDRVELRRRNLVAEEDIPYQLPMLYPYNAGTATDSGDYRATLDRCIQEFDWQSKEKLNGQLIDSRYHGIAVGCYIEGGAAGPSENARLVLETDGSISVYIGSSGVGQGLETVISQIAAQALGFPMSRVKQVRHGSTSFVKEGFGSFSSRSTVMGGSAVLDAGEKLLALIRSTAAQRFGCAATDVKIVEGREVQGLAGRSVSLAELAAEPLSAEGTFVSSKRTYSYGAHAAHVAVNPATGHVELVDYVAVEDVGRIINPHTLHGQTVGAIVQGLSGVLLEDLVYSEDAQLLSGTLADYLTASATDFPNIRAFALELRPSPNNPLGAKGAGEGGIIPVGGVIANAIAAALASLRVKTNHLPLSPPRLWSLIRQSQEKGVNA